MHNILIFSGSARQGNYTQHVANFVLEVATQNPEIHAEIVSPVSLGLNFDDEGTQAKYPELTAKVTAADAFIIVTPEYNRGYPGSLKYMIDLHFKEYSRKAVAIVSVSDGSFGGVRASQSLVPVLRRVGLLITQAEVNVSNVNQEIENGVFKDREAWEKRVNKVLTELLWLSQVLKTGREQS